MSRILKKFEIQRCTTHSAIAHSRMVIKYNVDGISDGIISIYEDEWEVETSCRGNDNHDVFGRRSVI